jgi:hypothetical protein
MKGRKSRTDSVLIHNQSLKKDNIKTQVDGGILTKEKKGSRAGPTQRMKKNKGEC